MEPSMTASVTRLPRSSRKGSGRVMRAAVLTLAGLLGVTALGLMALSLYWADLLADWRLPGLAALAAIACNVMLMTAARLRH